MQGKQLSYLTTLSLSISPWGIIPPPNNKTSSSPLISSNQELFKNCHVGPQNTYSGINIFLSAASTIISGCLNPVYITSILHPESAAILCTPVVTVSPALLLKLLFSSIIK
jgi:hypothetical protein